MNVEIICVGTELLLGNILNTNAKYLSEKLAELGFNLFSQSVVGDNPSRLQKQISLSMARSEIVILSGGLGPTDDDITKETVAKVLGLPLENHQPTLKKIEEYFARTGRVMSENNKKQALTIKGATVLENDHGTAPGYFVKTTNGAVILLPGPPGELVPMFEDKVIPILNKYSDGTFVSHNVRIFGVGESSVAEHLGDLTEGKNPTVATYAKPGEVDVRITASAKNYREAESLCLPIIEKIEDIFGSHIYAVDSDSLQQRVVELLRDKNMKIATAESCTAGMLSGRITEIPGSSEVFEMGVTAYANYIKIQALGVSEDIINKKGAVCDEVAAQMAVGIRSMCNADIGVGITGVAGPGQSEGKPAGLVYIAVADKEKVFVRKIMGRGNDRENTRILATSTALDMVRRYIEGCQDIMSFGTAIGRAINLMEGYSLPKINKAPLAKQEPVSPKPAKAPEVTFTDAEIMNMFSTDDEDNLESRPEKLELEDDSLNFVFEDDFAVDSIGRFNEEKYEVRSENSSDFDIVDDNVVEKKKKKSFLSSILPGKADSTSEKIRKSIFIVAFLVLLGTMAYLVNYFVEGWIQIRQIEQAAAVWDDPESLKKNENGIYIGFEELMQQNSDIRAWLKIDGTRINNPVYQTDNNDFYIDHDMNKQSSRYGALFIDEAATIKNTLRAQSQNVVVYGHHMKDGTMFAPLKNYVNLDFYKENPIIDFRTLYYEDEYKIFAVFITNNNPAHDKGNVFNYRQSSFATDADFMYWIDEVKRRSVINTGVDIAADDYILTLSTCTYEFDDARLVVMARRVRDGEKNATDTRGAAINPKPLYPQIWYDEFGGKKPAASSKPSASSNNGIIIPNDVNSGYFGGNISDIGSDIMSDIGSDISSDMGSTSDISSTDNVSGTPSAGSSTPSDGSSSSGGSSSDGSSTPGENSSTASASSQVPPASSSSSQEPASEPTEASSEVVNP